MVNPADTAGTCASSPVPPIPPRLWLRLSFSIHAPLQTWNSSRLGQILVLQLPAAVASGCSAPKILPRSCPNLRHQRAPGVVSGESKKRAGRRTLTACLPQPAKSQGWTKDRPRLNPSLTCPGSTRVDPDSQRLHLGCGCEHEIWPSV